MNKILLFIVLTIFFVFDSLIPLKVNKPEDIIVLLIFVFSTSYRMIQYFMSCYRFQGNNFCVSSEKVRNAHAV